MPGSTVNANVYVIIELCSTFGNTSTPKVDFGPGYRIYFGRDGDRLVILLAGGMKKRQQEDIRQAKANWLDYRHRKIQEETRCH
jgi:putative addiction module killer protein